MLPELSSREKGFAASFRNRWGLGGRGDTCGCFSLAGEGRLVLRHVSSS